MNFPFQLQLIYISNKYESKFGLQFAKLKHRFNFTVLALSSQKVTMYIVHEDAKDVQIEDCKKLAKEEHLDIILSTAVAEHKGVETRTVWSGQEWKNMC